MGGGDNAKRAVDFRPGGKGIRIDMTHDLPAIAHGHLITATA
jgi:hypothetical protein